jgi:hypothetical protein
MKEGRGQDVGRRECLSFLSSALISLMIIPVIVIIIIIIIIIIIYHVTVCHRVLFWHWYVAFLSFTVSCFSFNLEGGLHRALSQSGVDASVIRAYDWDAVACSVYSANHGPGIVQRVKVYWHCFR